MGSLFTYLMVNALGRNHTDHLPRISLILSSIVYFGHGHQMRNMQIDNWCYTTDVLMSYCSVPDSLLIIKKFTLITNDTLASKWQRNNASYTYTGMADKWIPWKTIWACGLRYIKHSRQCMVSRNGHLNKTNNNLWEMKCGRWKCETIIPTKDRSFSFWISLIRIALTVFVRAPPNKLAVR